jgi:hypothetical protein
VIHAVFDTDRETLRRLDRIEAKLEVLRTRTRQADGSTSNRHQTSHDKKRPVELQVPGEDVQLILVDLPFPGELSTVCAGLPGRVVQSGGAVRPLVTESDASGLSVHGTEFRGI